MKKHASSATLQRYSPLLLLLLSISLCVPVCDAREASPVYRSAEASTSARIADLLKRMTLAEKIGQLNQLSGHQQDKEKYRRLVAEARLGSLLNVAFSGIGVEESGVYIEGASRFFSNRPEWTNDLQKIAVEETRLGIPLLYAHDVIHGYRTIFPVPLAEASSWNPEAARLSARVAAQEASAVGIRWTFAPMIDVARDPRWGRIVEGSGEDPYLNCVMAVARVEGFQGEDLSDSDSLLATAKHYLAYGAAEGGRDYNTADVSERTLRETYLPPFAATVEAGVGSVMVAFNEINGVPATANKKWVRDVLRGELGFDGLIVSDWGSVSEMINHRSAADLRQASQQALQATVDIDMESRGYSRHLEELIEAGEINEVLVDDAVGRLLTAKFELGLFEAPYIDTARIDEVILNNEHRTAARQVARESIVLLKNEDRTLPIAEGAGKVAVIGPLAENAKAQLGSWFAAGRQEDCITPLAALRQRLGDRVVYARGAEVEGSDRSGFEAAIAAARQAEVAILFLGEHAQMSGEAKSRAALSLPGVQQELLEAVYATGVPTVLVLQNGRPLAVTWAAENVPAIVEAWFLGIEAGPAIVDVLMGDYNPSGKLPVTFPRSVGHLPAYYNHKNTGRPKISRYLTPPREPLFAFGHGLSYTTFAHSEPRLAAKSIGPGETTRVSVAVRNTGDRAGAEVVQLYVRDLVASTTPPVLRLAGFQRVNLEPGESRELAFDIGPAQLSRLASDWSPVVEPGDFEILVGGSSAELQSAPLTVTRPTPGARAAR